MKCIYKATTALGLVLAASLVAAPSAKALNGPQTITIDGGPLGSLLLSGGADGYGYYVSNTAAGVKNNGAYAGSVFVELQKNSGVLQFTVEVGPNGGTIPLGTTPTQTSANIYTTGPLFEGYLTIAPPNSPVTVSVGQLGSLEGFEAGTDWLNNVQLTTALWAVQNANSRGVSAMYSQGPLTATVEFGDGFDTGVFNFLQALVSYAFDGNNIANVYYAGNLGATGLNAYEYGNTTVGSYGANFVNSQMLGGYYVHTDGNLTLTPEVQYVYAKANRKLGLTKGSGNFGAALFGDYAFGASPYSLGAWVEYEDSTGHDIWASGPGSEAVGAALAPTWQYKDLFARVNAGAYYLLNNKQFSTASFGANGRGKFQFLGTLEAGLLF
ncbi:hypothetical protein [Acidocella sp.]|uniref:hypothetical protein n=1 Tax=Acidocella sp. TaxID=50710 RepID=UPI00260E91C2|nr:hypothetical protein [Acidocella sp.]